MQGSPLGQPVKTSVQRYSFVEGLDNNRILKPLLMQSLRKFFQLDELEGSKMFNLL